MRRDFASDNVAGLAPAALAALVASNRGAAASYGDDATTSRAADLVRALLDVDAPVHFLATGTAANAIALASLCRPFEATIVHELAHVRVDEAGAPGFYGQGAALLPVGGAHGRIDPDALRALVAHPASSSRQPPVALSLTNATECGTLYADAALGELAHIAREHGLRLHLDGARLANAVAAGATPTGLDRLGFATVVVGGSKAGMAASEALVLLDRSLERNFVQRLKQAGHLVAKSRFVAAPWLGMLESGAWLAQAQHANAMARRLADAMPFPLCHPAETNAVFAELSDDALAALRRRGWEVFRMRDGAVRFMCAWSTGADEVDELAALLRDIHRVKE